MLDISQKFSDKFGPILPILGQNRIFLKILFIMTKDFIMTKNHCAK